ncbi:MAG TPA: hypothetical protein VHE35_11905, partial [Kofleriaceae bacterium]|nr:hypothetical protein [Kofleriaceae bacterium]
ALLAALLVSTGAPVARADDAHGPDGRTRVAGPGPAQQLADRLARGESLYADQEYAAAIKALVPVTRDRDASRAQRVRAWEVIALARFILGDEAGARDAFERVLELDPGFELRDTSGSPRIRAFFDQIRREAVPDSGDAGAVDLDHAAPAAATAGSRLELEVRVTRGAPLVREVAVDYRPLGALAYREAAATRAGDDRWRIAIALPAARQPGTLEYYVVARGAAGELARIASPDVPLTLAVAPGGSTGRRPPWRRWYVVAGVAVLAVGGTVAYLTEGSGAPGGTLPPGTITVTP